MWLNVYYCYLSSVGCTGTEARLIDCVVGSSVPSYCSSHYYDVGVTCIGKSDSPIYTSSITPADFQDLFDLMVFVCTYRA